MSGTETASLLPLIDRLKHKFFPPPHPLSSFPFSLLLPNSFSLFLTQFSLQFCCSCFWLSSLASHFLLYCFYLAQTRIPLPCLTILTSRDEDERRAAANAIAKEVDDHARPFCFSCSQVTAKTRELTAEDFSSWLRSLYKLLGSFSISLAYSPFRLLLTSRSSDSGRSDF